jgi:membrane protease YdiL (CAAX protease family)
MADGGCGLNKDYWLRLLWASLTKFKKQVISKRNLRYFLYYAAANFLILILFSYYQSLQPVNLDLKPVTSPQVEGSFLLFVAAVILLPLSLLFEELGFRLLPMLFIRDLFHLNRITYSIVHEEEITIVHNSPLRLWLYHHWTWVFIVVSALWAGLLHQINVVNSDFLGSLIYFGVQTFSGFCFAWIYVKRGLGAAWAVHTAWDLFLITLNLIIVSFVLG